MRWTRVCFFGLASWLLVAVLIGMTEKHAAAHDYVINGGFEDGTDGWTATPSVDFATGPVGVGAPEGDVAARLTLSGSSFLIRQTSWDGVPAGTYRLSARVLLSSSAIQVYAQASSNPSVNTFRFDAPSVAGQWITVEGDVNATGFTNLALSVGGAGPAGTTVYVDDVRFEGAPPATMTPTSTHTSGPPATIAGGLTPKASQTAASTPTPTPTTGQTAIGPDLRNGDFEEVTEDGLPLAWETYGGSLTSTTAAVAEGARAGRFESTTESTKWLYQAVAVEGGSGYAFDAWILHNDSGVAVSYLRISWYASGDGSGEAISTTDSSVALDVPSPEYRWLTTEGVQAPPEARSARLRVVLDPVSSSSASILVDGATFGPASVTQPIATAAPAEADEHPPAISRLASSRRNTGQSAGSAPVHATTQAPGGVVINEMLYDPDDATQADGDAEWIELYNNGDEPAVLDGWSLADNARVVLLPTLIILPRSFVVVAASDDFRGSHPDFAGTLVVLGGRLGNGLGNDGDRLMLRDPAGAIVDALSWGTDTAILVPAIEDVPEGHSIERRAAGIDTDAASDWVDNERPSPGAPFSPDLGTGAGARVGVEIVEPGDGSVVPGWLPWVLVAASSVALVGVVSWRALPGFSRRLRHP